MVDVGSLQAAYNDAVAKGNKKLAEQLLALWRDTLEDRKPLSVLYQRGATRRRLITKRGHTRGL
jgi:hypothetical protein